MRFVVERIQFHPLSWDVTERMSVTPAKVSLAAPPTNKWQQKSRCPVNGRARWVICPRAAYSFVNSAKAPFLFSNGCSTYSMSAVTLINGDSGQQKWSLESRAQDFLCALLILWEQLHPYVPQKYEAMLGDSGQQQWSLESCAQILGRDPTAISDIKWVCSHLTCTSTSVTSVTFVTFIKQWKAWFS